MDLMDLDVRRAMIERLKILTRPAVWLRPSPASTGMRTSKIGGQFAWPPGVSWPVCNTPEPSIPDDIPHNDNYVALAQFLKSDFPQISFPPESDILQLLWCPRHHNHATHPLWLLGPEIRAFWHSVVELEERPNPIALAPNPFLVPQECTFHPVWLDDTPDWLDLSEAERHRIDRHLTDVESKGDGAGVDYSGRIGAIPGTKLLGYPAWLNPETHPVCGNGHEMRHLFTVASQEVGDVGDWYFRYDPSFVARTVHRVVCPLGLDIIDGAVLIFYCEVCPDRPVRAVMQSG